MAAVVAILGSQRDIVRATVCNLIIRDHIHVGFGMPVPTAEALMEATLEAVLRHHPAAQAECP